MTNFINSLYNMHELENLSKKTTFIHRLHPMVKLITTAVYLTVVLSFGRYEVTRLIPLIIYPVVLITLAEVPTMLIIKRIILIEPLIIGIGILNPIFDRQLIIIEGIPMVGGWIALASIIIKGILTISVALLLVATIGIDKIAGSMRSVRIPKVFVLQLLLTYRYISVLIEEVERLIRAYLIRAPKQKGVQPNVWGSLAGQLLIRSFDRAGRVYQAMLLRGFTGEYDTGGNTRIKMFDIVFMGLWVLFFLIVRIFNLPEIIGIIITGGIL